MNEKISRKIQPLEARPHDWADHRSGRLDPRRVTRVSGKSVWIDIFGVESGPYPLTNYTYYRLVGTPSEVVCPACNAQPGAPCTQPTNNGRVDVSWFHNPRRDEVAE